MTRPGLRPEPSAPPVFVSYRRDDSAGHARALHRELCRRFDPDFVFFDRAAIVPGEDFPERLRQAVGGCAMMLVLVGPDWLDARGADGRRRLEDDHDFVRREVALALAQRKVVLPVLVDDTPMPAPQALPAELAALAARDAVTLRGKAYEYERQLEDLVRWLAQHTGRAPQRADVGIAFGLGDEVAVYRQVEYLPVRLRAPLRETFRSLVEERCRFFAGRRAVIDELMGFVAGAAPGYCMVVAPAGFGKTALAARLVADAGEAFAYHFFTPLHGDDTLSEAFFLRSMLEQMAAWHGQSWDLPSDLDGLRATWQQVVERPLARPALLLLDGLDEVRGWSLRPYLSRRLPPSWRVVLTLRDVGQDWRAGYGLPADQVHELRLDGLDRAEFDALLAQAGEAAAPLLRDLGARERLFEIATAEGAARADPFYARFLVEDLADGTLTRDRLAVTPRGLEAYLDQWWAEIRRAAGDQPVRDLFGTLAVAAGPLTRGELEALNPSLVDGWDAGHFDECLQRARRLVARDAGGGHQLLHPRLRDFMQRRIRTDPYRARLLAFCRDWRGGSRYALAHIGLHLAEAGDWPALRGLVASEAEGRAYLDARLAAETTAAGFERDLERFWSHADETVAAGRGTLADPLRCALVASSLRSRAGSLLPGLVAAALRHGLWTRETALGHAAGTPDPVQRAAALAALLPQAGPEECYRICRAVIDAARQTRADARRPPVVVLVGAAPPTREPDRRGEVLAPVLAYLPVALREEALAIARSVEAPITKPALLAALAAGADAAERDALVDEALAAVDQVPPSRAPRFGAVPLPVRKARAAIACSQQLAPPWRGQAQRIAIDHAAATWPRWRAAMALEELMPALDPPLAAEAAQRMIGCLEEDEGGRDLALRGFAIAHLAPGAVRDALLADLRARAQSEADPVQAVGALAAIAGLLGGRERDALLDDLLARAPAVEDPDARCRACGQIAQTAATAARRRRALSLAVRAARELEDDDETWVDAVLPLLPRADAALVRRLYEQGFALADPTERIRLCDAAALRLGRDDTAWAIGLGQRIGDDACRALDTAIEPPTVRWRGESDPDEEVWDFYAVARPRTAAEARAIAFDLERVAGLVAVAGDRRRATDRALLCTEAFDEAWRINDPERRQAALAIAGGALAALPREEVLPCWTKGLRHGARRRRHDLVGELAALRPLLRRLDQDAEEALPDLVAEICSWMA